MKNSKKNNNSNKKSKNRKAKNVNSKELDKELKNTKKKGFWKRHPKLKIFIRTIIILIILAIIIGAGIVAGFIFGDKWEISKDDLILSNINTTIYDKNGNEIASVSGDEKRRIVSLNEIPKVVQDAFISIEDETFYEHSGVNWKRTTVATVSYLINRGSSTRGGGSTITQQLIKNLMKDDENSGVAGVERKIREISRAYQVEKILSKDQILELYLNIIFMGGDVYGVQLGSQYYFNKPVTELDLAEAAFLAGINHSPNSYNPFTETDNSEKIVKRTKIVLAKMKELGKINDEEYNAAVAKVEAGLPFEKGATASTSTMTYLAKAALNQVVKQYAAEKDVTIDYAETKIYGGGYKIYTTQDSDIQAIMDEIYHDDYYIVSGKNQHAQSAMVIIDHKTGQVVGCMGGLGNDVNSNGLNRATQSTRQPGSSIKPIASIAPALESGIITASTVYDESNTYFGNYNPTNSGKGLITVRKAIEISANTTEVKIMSELGPSNSIAFLRKLGVTSLVTASENAEQNDENLALVLGGLTYGISPLEMAGAYAAIANNGVYITPTFYSKVEDSAGNVVLEPVQEKTRVLSEGNAFILQSILTGPVTGSSGTATVCRISGMDVGAKTGTTTKNLDRWLCGFTPYYTASTWYGYDDNEVINTGYNPASRIWAAVMKKVHSNLEGTKFEKPSNVVTATVCKDSGKLATDSCTNTYTEYFVKGTVPDECDGHKILTICTDTGKIANEYCPNTEEKIYTARPEKEDTTLWKTTNSEKYDVPTEVCTEHTKQVVKMINVVGLSKEDAMNKLKALGLTVTVETKESDKKEGIVLSQNKSEGAELSAGETVTIVVSKKKSSSSSSGGNNEIKNEITNSEVVNKEID